MSSKTNETDHLSTMFTEWPRLTFNGDAITIKSVTKLSELEDIEIIFNPKATILTDKRLKRKAVVKRCELDEDDREKAFLYAFAKLHGITPRMIDRKLKEAIMQEGKKHEKKAKKIEEVVSNNI